MIKSIVGKSVSVYKAVKDDKTNKVCKVIGTDEDGELIVSQTSLNGKMMERVMRYLGGKGLTGDMLATGELNDMNLMVEHDGIEGHSWTLSIDGSDEEVTEECGEFLDD